MLSKMLKNARLAVIALSTMALTGCLLPSAPKADKFAAIEKRESYDVYTMKRKHDPSKTMRATTKNLILVTADTFLSEQFQPQLDAAYQGKRAPTLNELAWWAYQPLLRDIYNKVIYLNVDQAKHAIIVNAIQYMEKQSMPYDLIILSHGIPNHLTTGEVGYFMSFKEIQDLGKLKNLNLVFMQACFGKSLVQDWMNAGARRVMSYDGFNRNFFFISVFLDHHRFYDEDGAFATANRDMEKELNKKKLYKELIKRGLGTDVHNYLSQVDEPILDKSTTRK
jgi:hypothetical protein